MDQSFLAAPHSLSQLSTSFIASITQGIHHLPLKAFYFQGYCLIECKILVISLCQFRGSSLDVCATTFRLVSTHLSAQPTKLPKDNSTNYTLLYIRIKL